MNVIKYLIVGLILSSISAVGFSKSYTQDHHTCYFTDAGVGQPNPATTPVNGTVTIEDQFITDVIDFVNARATALCVPTEKVHLGKITPILNPDDNLACYAYPIPVEDYIDPELKVKNQFGKEEYQIDDSLFGGIRFLCIPSQLKEIGGVATGLGEPSGIDHFQCYTVAAMDIGVPRATVDLDDEIAWVQDLDVLQPFAHCNPAVVTYDNYLVGIINPKTHMSCNVFEQGVNFLPGPTTVKVDNELGEQDLVLVFSNNICLPSKLKKVR